MGRYDRISLMTDYGTADGYGAACHGVIASIAPHVRVIDVTHEIPQGDVQRGALVLAQTVGYLPPSVHVAVVDPGVGTKRRAVAVGTAAGILVGPDNGLLPWAADALGGARVAVVLGNERLFRHPVSRTFHGRDIFAPVAAHLANGTDLDDAGPPLDVNALVRLPDPSLATGPGWVEAEVLGVDRFGNLQLAAGATELDALEPVLDVSGARAARGTTFGSVRPDELVVYVDSAGRVAVAVNSGDAARRLGVGPGDVVRITGADRA